MSKPILVPIDLFQDAVLDSLLGAAMDYADSHDAPIHLLTVLPDLDAVLLPYINKKEIEEIVGDAQRKLEKIGTQRIGGAHEWQADAMTGRVAPTIIRIADERAVALIVMASHNPLFSDIFFGSVAAKVVRSANHSVLIVRQPKKAS